jgi:hypothetical protein
MKSTYFSYTVKAKKLSLPEDMPGSLHWVVIGIEASAIQHHINVLHKPAVYNAITMMKETVRIVCLTIGQSAKRKSRSAD